MREILSEKLRHSILKMSLLPLALVVIPQAPIVAEAEISVELAQANRANVLDAQGIIQRNRASLLNPGAEVKPGSRLLGYLAEQHGLDIYVLEANKKSLENLIKAVHREPLNLRVERKDKPTVHMRNFDDAFRYMRDSQGTLFRVLDQNAQMPKLDSRDAILAAWIDYSEFILALKRFGSEVDTTDQFDPAFKTLFKNVFVEAHPSGSRASTGLMRIDQLVQARKTVLEIFGKMALLKKKDENRKADGLGNLCMVAPDLRGDLLVAVPTAQGVSRSTRGAQQQFEFATFVTLRTSTGHYNPAKLGKPSTSGSIPPAPESANANEGGDKGDDKDDAADGGLVHIFLPAAGILGDRYTTSPVDMAGKIKFQTCPATGFLPEEDEAPAPERPDPADGQQDKKTKTARQKALSWLKDRLVIRGNIDELTVSKDDAARYKDLDSAKASLTTNFVTQSEDGMPTSTETFNAKAYLGFGTRFGNKKNNKSGDDSIYGFIGYERNSTEVSFDNPAEAPEEDPDATPEADDEEVELLSLGAVFARDLRFRSVLSGSLITLNAGIASYYVNDYTLGAPNLWRTRFFFDNLTYISGDSRYGSTWRTPCVSRQALRLSFIPIQIQCGVKAFGEVVRVDFSAADRAILAERAAAAMADMPDAMMMDEDSFGPDLTDDYIGLGATVSATFKLVPGLLDKDNPLQWTQNLSLAVDYQYLWIVEGDNRDPGLFKAELKYTFENSPLSFGILYEDGRSFENFNRIENLKFELGMKF